MKNEAIYHPVSAERVEAQDTLVYDQNGGFAWVRPAKDAFPDMKYAWHCFSTTVVDAESQAREAGLDPKAVYYIFSR